MNENDKRAQICALSYLPLAGAKVRNLPGAKSIRVSGEWTDIPISKGEFKEKTTSGSLVEQEIKATVTDTGGEFSARMRDLLNQEGLVRLKFTNGAEKVVGSDQFPVLLTLEESGSPAAFSLSCKRNSPEPAKTLRPFVWF